MGDNFKSISIILIPYALFFILTHTGSSLQLSSIRMNTTYNEHISLHQNHGTTRMHSSRMRTVYPMSIPACTGRGAVSQNALDRGVYPSMHWAGGVCPEGGYVSQHALGQTPPRDRMTDRCKNITLSQLRCGR